MKASTLLSQILLAGTLTFALPGVASATDTTGHHHAYSRHGWSVRQHVPRAQTQATGGKHFKHHGRHRGRHHQHHVGKSS
jgi:hypothetical protein